jgi:HEAT repeat protein
MGRTERSALLDRSEASPAERPRAAEISVLVRKLQSRDRRRVDAARARLAMLGGLAVEPLVEALDSDEPRVRIHALELLGLIRDRRGQEPVMAMLLDRDARVRETASRCLGRFPTREATAALERLLSTERQLSVRMAAVRSLLDHYQSGLGTALRRPIEILLDEGEHPKLRAAALSLLPLLNRAERTGLLRRLKQDRSADIRARAAAVAKGSGSRAPHGRRSLEALVDSLGSDDYEVWKRAVQALAARGVAAVRVLLREIERRAHDPEYCLRAGMTLKAFGPRQAGLLAEALDRIREPLPLQVLVEVAGALGDKPLVYRLKDLIERLAAEERTLAPRDGFDPLRRVRALAHLELARIGSRVAIDDLRQMLADPDHPLEIELVAAIERIGKREEILELLRAYGREDRFVREGIGRAVRAIMKREKIRRNDGMFRNLAAGERRALEAIVRSAAARGSCRVRGR